MKTREEKRKEALERIKALDFHPNVEKEWLEDGTIYYSDRCRLGGKTFGILYWCFNDQRFMDAIRKFEEEHDAVVYHATHENTAFGELLSLLYVSNFDDEWEKDRADLQTKDPDGSIQLVSYVVNLSDPMSSEFGYITIKEAGGGLIRVA